MEVEVGHVTDVAWMVSGPSGHGVIIDGAPKIGGRNLGMRPMEMVLAGLGGCTAMDVMTTLRKQRQDVTDCRITLHAERADAGARGFHRDQDSLSRLRPYIAPSRRRARGVAVHGDLLLRVQDA